MLKVGGDNIYYVKLSVFKEVDKWYYVIPSLITLSPVAIVTTSLLRDIYPIILMELKHCFEIGWYNMYMIPITTVMSHEWQIYHT